MFASSAMFYPLRLFPGQELLTELRSFMQTYRLKAAFIAASVGSLTDVSLRFAGQTDKNYFSGTFEIISLSGTLDENGEHLHLAISDGMGRMMGGHVMPGCIIRTTLELVLGELTSLEFNRTHCHLSGYEELDISKRQVIL